MLEAYTALGTGTLIAAIGTWVLLSDIRIHVRRLFFFFACGLSVWSVSFGLLLLSHDFFFNQFIFYSLFPIFGGLFLFVLAYPNATSTPHWAYLEVLPTLLIAIGGAFGLCVSGMHIRPDNTIEPINGPLMPLLVIIAGGYILLSLGTLLRKFRYTTTYRDMTKLWYLTVALCTVAGSLVVFDALLPALRVTTFIPAGSVSIALFCIWVAYAIVRYELLDIRLVIQRGFVYSMLFTLIACIYTVLLVSLSSLFSIHMQQAAHYSAAVAMLIGVATVPMLDQYLRRKTDRIFFKDRYDYKDALQELSGILHIHTRKDDIISESTMALQGILRTTYVSFISHSNVDILKEKPVLVFSVVSKRGKIGTLIAGKKRSGDSFLPEDITLLDTFSVQMAIALDKAELYQQLEAYSKTLEERVAARTQEVTALREQERHMFADISHALQTPLTVLKSGIEVVAKQTRDRATLSAMERSIETTSQLVYSLLRITRLESHIEEAPKEIIAMSDLVMHVVEYVDTICMQHSITLESSIEPSIAVRGNRVQLEELFTNLLSNAVKYTKDSSSQRIMVTLERIGNETRLTVADTGIGIPRDKLPLIFNRFYRAHEDGLTATEGTGLGLAICKRIAEEHGGSITVESAEGMGATFTVIVPIVPLAGIEPTSTP